MRGGDLFQQLTRASTFSEAHAARLAKQIIGAVSHLHIHGIVHCDLKPSNILVLEKHSGTPRSSKEQPGESVEKHVGTPRTSKEQPGESADENGADMIVKVADFGLSQSLGMREGSQEKLLTDICGTPDYFAPELADMALTRKATEASEEASEWANVGKGYGPPIDCWAVGCIVYELLVGHPPYQAHDDRVLFYKIIENQMEFPKDVFDNISPDAIKLIKELTATDPDERLSCEQALAHAWLAEDNATLAATPLPEETKRRRRKLSIQREDAKDAMLAAALAAAGIQEVQEVITSPAGE